ELRVRISTSWRPKDPTVASEGRRLLSVGGEPYLFESPHSVSVITEPDSKNAHDEPSISMRFFQVPKAAPLWEQDGFFRPFADSGTLLSAEGIRLQAR